MSKDNTVRKFNHAAVRQNPGVFVYADEVRKVWHDFPEKKDKLHFIDLCDEKLLVRPGNAEEADVIAARVIDERLRRSIKSMAEVDRSSCYMPMHGALLLYTQKHKFSFIAREATPAQEILFVLDHELGHALAPGGLYDGGVNKGECVADAHGTIRHLQRFGADSPVIDRLVQQRAFHFLFRPSRVTHYTSTVVEQILQRRHDIDWDALTPQQTLDLAWRFARTYAMHPVRLDALEREMIGFHGKIDLILAGDTVPLRLLAHKILTTDAPEVFKCGMAALQLCFDGQVQGVELAGIEWDSLRRKLDARQRMLESRDELLFGFDDPACKDTRPKVLPFSGPRL